jgi:hypothetical protein
VLARTRGWKAVFPETFSFQAPRLCRSLGYTVAHENRLFPQGIVKHHTAKRLAATPGDP